MNGVLEAQRRVLGAMQQACVRQPGVHAHQLCALDRDQALCANAATLLAYQRAAGGGFELARAAWLDRVAGRVRVALAVGDRFAARAALAEYRGALAAHDLSGWSTALVLAAHAAAPWRERAAQAGSSLTRTVLNLLLHHSCTPPLADHWADAVGAWRALCAADAAAARALQHGAAWPARMAPRLPWRDGAARAWLQRMLAPLPAPPLALPEDEESADADAGTDAALLAQLSDLSAAWQRSLYEGAPTAVDPAWTAAAASANQALAPWRCLAQPPTGAAPATLAMAAVAQRLLALAAGARNGPEVQLFALESGLMTELAAAPLRICLDEIEKRQAVWPQPLLVAHTRALRAGVAQAGTAGEIELLSAHADACLEIEADWQSLFLATHLAPLQAALNFGISPNDADRGLRGVSSICRGLLGQAPMATFQGGLAQTFVLDHLVEGAHGAHGTHRVHGAPSLAADAVAWRGEFGYGLLPQLRAWCAVAASRGETVHRDHVGLPAALLQLASRCLDATPAAGPAVVQLWGTRADAAHAAQLLAAPGRPAVPLWQAQGDADGAV